MCACVGGARSDKREHQGVNLSNVNISYLVNTTRLIVATMAYIADTGITHPQVMIESPKRGTLYIDGRKRMTLPELYTFSTINIQSSTL